MDLAYYEAVPSRKINDKLWGDHLICEPVALKGDLCKNLKVRKVRLAAPRPYAQRIRLLRQLWERGAPIPVPRPALR